MSAIVSMIPRRRSAALPVLAAVAMALLSGCANMKTDSVTVGAVPDDYRTNHPIVVGEKQESIDIPVASDGYRVTRGQQELVAGFLSGYDRRAGTPVTILVPVGSANSAAASAMVSDLGRGMRRQGVSNVYVQSYQVDRPDVSAPVRVSYVAIRATTDKCGRWPADLGDNPDNRHWANFGCSYQNNLAAQVANPSDLLGPRKQTTIDAERRDNVIEAYRNAPVFIATPRQEVNY